MKVVSAKVVCVFCCLSRFRFMVLEVFSLSGRSLEVLVYTLVVSGNTFRGSDKCHV